jgi:hypothetical protein
MGGGLKNPPATAGGSDSGWRLNVPPTWTPQEAGWQPAVRLRCGPAGGQWSGVWPFMKNGGVGVDLLGEWISRSARWASLNFLARGP